MSIEIGVPSKTIRYLNLHKEGTHGQNNFCSIDSRWRTPVIDKLDEYTVAVSRFQVPANRLAMTQKLEKCIVIWLIFLSSLFFHIIIGFCGIYKLFFSLFFHQIDQ